MRGASANFGEPEAIEPAFVSDTFVSGMLPPEDLGENVRITWYADRAIYPGKTERVIVARIVGSKAELTKAHFMIGAFIGSEAGKKVVPIR